MNTQITASKEYRVRWGRTTKRAVLGHQKREARYIRAIGRTSQERRDKIKARVLIKCGLVAYPTEVGMIANVDKLIAHKLGERNK